MSQQVNKSMRREGVQIKILHPFVMSLRYDEIALRYEGIVIGGFCKALSEKSLLLLGGWYFKRWGWYFGRVEVLVGKQLRYIFAT